MQEDQFYLEELKKDFFDEAHALIDILETNILYIEKDPSNREAINEIFRAAHTLKGGSATLDMDRIANFTHEMESLLDEIRSNTLKLTSPIIDTLLKAIDIVKELIHCAQNNEEADLGYEEDVLKRVRNHYLNPSHENVRDTVLEMVREQAPPKRKKINFDLNEYDRYLIRKAKETGLHIWEIFIVLSADNPMKTVSGIQIHSALKEIGDIIKSLPDIDELMQDVFYKEISFLHASKESQERIRSKISFSDVVNFVDITAFEDSSESNSSSEGISVPMDIKLNAANGSKLARSLKENLNAYLIHIIFDETNPMRSVSGVLIHSMLTSIGEMIQSFPDFDELRKDVFYQNSFYVFATKLSDTELKNKIYISDVTKEINFKPIRQISDISVIDVLDQLNLPSSEDAHKSIYQPVISSDSSDGDQDAENESDNGADKGSGRTSTDKKSQLSMLRVESRRIDDILNLVSELVITKASFQEITERNAHLHDSLNSSINLFKKDVKNMLAEVTDEEEQTKTIEEERLWFKDFLNKIAKSFDQIVPLSKQIQDKLRTSAQILNRTTNELHESVMKVRMVPINHVFSRFPRLVRDLSKNLHKDIALIMEGEETELDKGMVEELFDPIVHIIRNAVDHGIETAEVRSKAGKNGQGTIQMRAEHEGNHIVITISDDGGGINVERVQKKAIEKGLIDGSSEITKQQAIELIFHPGFSTHEEVSSVSGRGVGMDVVKRKIEGIKGSIDVDTEQGVGSIFTIKLPMTLAIVQALMVKVSEYIYSIPISHVSETQRISQEDIEYLEGNEIIKIRDEVLGLIRLDQLFKHRHKDKKDYFYVIIVEIGVKKIGLIVDNMIGEQDVVIKPLDNKYANVPGIMGATILGDGQVSLILDVSGIFELVIQQKANEIMGLSL